MANKFIVPDKITIEPFSLETTPLSTIVETVSGEIYMRVNGYWANLATGQTNISFLHGRKLKEVTLKEK